jgi:hypothetical protein
MGKRHHQAAVIKIESTGRATLSIPVRRPIVTFVTFIIYVIILSDVTPPVARPSLPR